MSKQLLFYERVTPVTQQRHAKWSIDTGRNFAFAREVNSVPLMAVEFPAAAHDHTIVFAGSEGSVMPVVILGSEGNENAYLDAENGWDASYIPAFVRRFPFVFARNDDGGSFTLCIDESWSGCNEAGRGERLFTDDGVRTPYLENVLSFLQDYQSHFKRTQAFCQKLKDLDLLEQMQAQFKLPSGSQRSLTGFMAINRDRLKALSGDVLADLARTDELELIYMHLHSMNNFKRITERLAKRQATAADAMNQLEEPSQPEAGGAGELQ